MKEKKKKKELGWELCPCERGKAPSPWEPLHQLADQLEHIGSFTGSEQSATPGLWQAEQRETSTDDPGYLAALPSLRRTPTIAQGGWVLKLGLQWTDPGRGLGLAAQRQLKGPGVWSGPHLGVCVGWSPGPPQKPHCQPV